MQVVEKTVGPGMPLSDEDLADSKRKLTELNRKDAERKRTAELKNNLEGYIYSTREKVCAFPTESDLSKYLVSKMNFPVDYFVLLLWPKINICSSLRQT